MKFESQLQIVTAAGVPPFTVNQTAAVINLNADLLDGQHGAYYLDCANFTGTLAAGRLSGSYPISVTGYSYAVFVADTRDDATTPQTINRGVVFDFKANSSNGLNDGGNYFGLLTFRQYGSGTDWTGGSSHQLGFTDNGNVWQRSGSNTTWGAWKKLLDSSNYGGYSTFTGTVTGTNFSGPGTGLTGTAAALNIGGTAAIATNIADGAVSTSAKIAASVVTYAKIQNVAVSSVLGNSSASVAQAPQELSMATLAGMLSGQTMSIVGSSTSCTGNAATATNVAWSGITSKPTTLAGFGITDALDTSATAQTKSGNLTVNSALTSGGAFYAATTVQYSNRQQIYTVYYGGGQDLNWKKIADITIGVGLYRAVTFRVDVVDNQGNFGWNSDCYPMTFFASCRRSGGVQDSYNDAWVTGPVSDYVRVVKTALGVYELQIRQLADWQTYVYTAEATINSGTVVTYVSGTPPNGSTTGTVYAPTIDWTQKLAKLVVAGSATFASQITSSVATGTAPFSVASTTAVTNLNSDLLDGQHGAYYENRDTTAVGFSGGTLTLTRATGNLTVSLDGRYLTGNQSITLSGDVTGTGTTAITTTIPNSTITNAKLNTMGAGTIKGNNGAVANSPSDLTAAQVATMLSGQTMNISGSSTSCTGNAASASSVPWSGITSKPTTLSGYGITDALPLSGGTLTGTLYFTDSTNGIYKGGGRLSIRSESTDDVANFASYGLYLPKTGQTAGLYVESPIEARGGLRIGISAGSGTITVGADTAATANRLAQRDASGGINAVSFSGAGTGLTGTASSLTAGAVPWSGVTGKPTTLSGYGITDAMYQVDPNGFTQGDIYGSGNMQRLWGTDSVQNLIAFRPPTTVEYTVDGVNWVATTISSDVFDGKVFGKWGGFNMNVGSNIGAWTKVRMTWVNFGYHFFSHFTLCHSTNGHSMNFVFYKSDLNGVFGAESYRVNGISSWPGYTFTSHVNVSGWWDTRDVRMVFELIGNNGPSGYPNNAISVGHIGIMGGYSSFNRVYDWDGSRNITLYGNLTLPGNVSATGTVSGSSFTGAGTGLTGTANSLNVGGSAARWATGRTIALTGDVTATSGTFDGTANLSFAATIANSAVTYAKIQNVAVSSVLGNSSASVAQAPAALSMATLAGMLSGQTMNIVGSSTSCTGNAATATNVAWSGITSKPTTLGGFGITDAFSSSGGTLTGGLSGTSGYFSGDVTWSGSNSGNPRAVRIGYSGGNYGGISYGINYTATAGSHTYAIADAVTRIDLADGIQVYSAATGTVGAAVSWTTLLTAYRGNASLQWKGANVLDANNYTNYTLPRGGSWYGASLPGSRWGGFSANGGEVVFGQDLPNTGQMGVLIDGCYIAGENNGFWSLANSNDWTTRRGMYFDGTYLRFDYNSATAYFSNASINGNQVLHASNYSSYAVDNTKRVKQFFWDTLSASTTQARRFEIARIAIDIVNWNQVGTFEIELCEQYWSKGLKKKYIVSYGYSGTRPLLKLVEMSGAGENNFQVVLGSEQFVSGNHYYLPIYVDVRYYAYVDVRVTTSRLITFNSNPPVGYTYINTAPTPTNITDFSADSTVDISNAATAWLVGGNTILTSATTSAPNLSIGGNAAGLNNGSRQLSAGSANWIAWKSTSADSGASAIALYGSTGSWFGMLYGDSGGTGFLNTSNGWDLRKSINGELYATVSGTAQTVIHSGNYTSYLNNTYLRAAGHPGYGNWDTFGNTAQTVHQMYQENFNLPTSTGSSNFPTNASYKYGTLINFGTGSDARAQVYISHAGNDLVFRGGWTSSSWQTWNRCVTDINFPSFGTHQASIGNSLPTTVFMSTDANIRQAPFATAKAHLGITSKWANSRPNLTSDSNYWTGVMGWGTTDWNSIFDWGSGFTDSWSSPANNPGDSSHHTGIQAVHYTNGSSRYGWQIVGGAGNNRLWLRSVWGGSFTSWYELLHGGNYNNYAPTLTGTGASGTWGISITGNAATATNGFTVKPGWAGNQNLILEISNFNNSLPSGFYQGYQATNSPTATWYNLINVRHSNTGNDHGFQLAMSYYDEVLWSRTYSGGTGANNGTFTAWRAHLHSGNYNSYAPTLTGGGASGSWGINITGSSASCTGNAATCTTASGIADGAVSTTAKLANSVVTYAKIQNVTAYTVLGNSSPSAAQAPVEINMASLASMLSGNTMNISGSSTSCSGNAATASAVAASGITGQTGMWTSAARPGPYRLYRRDANDAYSVQNYWTGTYWRLDGYYSNDTVHAGCSVSYADSAGSASSASSATNSTQLNGQAASYYENRDTTAVGISAGTLTLTRAAGNLTTTIGGRVVAWCEFNGNFASSQSPNASFNVSSITKNATGDYTVNFSSALANTNYVVSGYAQLDTTNNSSNYNLYIGIPRRSGAKATGSCRIACEYPGNATLYDSVSIGVAFIAA
jgi:hypothetical protein